MVVNSLSVVCQSAGSGVYGESVSQLLLPIQCMFFSYLSFGFLSAGLVSCLAVDLICL